MSHALASLFVSLYMLAILMVVALPMSASAAVPARAATWRADLTRVAHSTWGLDAPVATFAAQVHAESGWNPQAVSRVGAAGMAQFMPATATWWCALNRLAPLDCQPSNPVWSMRALVGYDLWLFERVPGRDDYDRMWATLRSYNGGLGHWLNEAKVAQSADRERVDAACGKASRAPVHCLENLAYPDRILNRLQSLYVSWGRTMVPA